MILEARDGVALLPLFDLLLGSIQVAVAFGVATPAVGFGLDQGWTTAAAGARYSFARGSIDCEEIVPVHRHAREAIGRRTIGDVRDWEGARDMHGHGVGIILTEKDYRQRPDRGH